MIPAMLREKPLTIAQALKLYPDGTSKSTVIRHIKRGVKVRGGAVVKLEGSRMGARWTTTAEAIERFQDRLNAEAGTDPIPPELSLACKRDEAFLRQLGVH